MRNNVRINRSVYRLKSANGPLDYQDCGIRV